MFCNEQQFIEIFSTITKSIFTRGRFLYNQSQTLDLFLKPQIFRAKAANQFKGYKAPFNINIVEVTSETLLLLSQFRNLFHPTLAFFNSIFFLLFTSLSHSLFYSCNQLKISFHISSYFDHFILVTHIFSDTAAKKNDRKFSFHVFIVFLNIEGIFLFLQDLTNVSQTNIIGSF